MFSGHADISQRHEENDHRIGHKVARIRGVLRPLGSLNAENAANNDNPWNGGGDEQDHHNKNGNDREVNVNLLFAVTERNPRGEDDEIASHQKPDDKENCLERHFSLS